MGYCIGCNCLILVVAMFALVEVCFLFIDNQGTQQIFFLDLGIKYMMKTQFFLIILKGYYIGCNCLFFVEMMFATVDCQIF
jgi:hypothetical protein